jgi:hypothetical protein
MSVVLRFDGFIGFIAGVGEDFRAIAFGLIGFAFFTGVGYENAPCVIDGTVGQSAVA